MFILNAKTTDLPQMNGKPAATGVLPHRRGSDTIMGSWTWVLSALAAARLPLPAVREVQQLQPTKT